MSNEQLLRFFELKIEKSTRYHLRVAAVVGILCWALLLFLLFYDMSNFLDGLRDGSWTSMLLIAFLAFAPIVGFVATMRDRNKKKPINNIIYQTLSKNPEKIMWIYPATLTYNGLPRYSIFFQDDARNSFELDVSGKPEQEALVKGFATYCRYALIGFRPEWAPLYHKSPSTFKRDVLEYERNLKNE